QMYSGKIQADSQLEKYILTKLNVKNGSLQSESSSPKGINHVEQKTLRRATSKFILTLQK
ncbi:MAG: hypothetical protein RBR63_06205, partial [Methanosarcina vacuolata]|nr:hypothetical protein [Methanosarcina vacuolata]